MAAVNNFLTVGQQVLILFILVITGYILGKKNIIGESAGKALSDIALLLSTPCVIIKSFYEQRSSALGMLDFGKAMAAAIGVHIVAIVIAQLVYRKDSSKNRVLRASAVLSNAGFMGLPLQRALLGTTGVFYGAAYVTVFTLTLWTYGLFTMDKGARPSVRKLMVNPGVIGLTLGIVVFLIPFDLPEIVQAPIAHLAALNTPIPMLFIGYCLSKVDLGAALRSPFYYAASAVRLLAVPIVVIGVLFLAGVRGDLLCSMAIAGCAPTAAAVSMFAKRYGQDAETSSNLVALTTVFSVVTMPLVVAAVQAIA